MASFQNAPNRNLSYAKLSSSAAQSSFQEFGNPDLNPRNNGVLRIRPAGRNFPNNDVSDGWCLLQRYFLIMWRTKSAKVTFGTAYQEVVFTLMSTKIMLHLVVLRPNILKHIGKWFQGTLSGSYSYNDREEFYSRSSSAGSAWNRLMKRLKKIILSWDRPFQFNIMTMFNVNERWTIVFGFGVGILDNYSFYIHAFYESGKTLYTGYLFPELLAQWSTRYIIRI